MSATDWALLAALSLLWGGSFYFAKVAVLEIPPLTLAFGRVGIAAACLVIFARSAAGPFSRGRRMVWQFTVLATLNNVIPFTLIFWGQIHITVGLASILNATGPLFTVVVAHMLTHDDKLTPGRVLGLVAGFAGVVVLIGPDMLSEFGMHVWAELALLGAACSYAFAAVYTRRLHGLRGLPPVAVASGQLTMAALLLAPLALLIDQPWTLPSGVERRDLVDGRAGDPVDRDRLPDLLPHPRPRRRDQRDAGDVPDSGQRDPARNPAARRSHRAAPARRHGGDRARPRRDRRTARALAEAFPRSHSFVIAERPG